MNGRVTDIERFTEGDCWLLAKRLHRITGWPIYSFEDGYGPQDHGFVLTPAKLALDVEGVCSLDAMCKRYGFQVKHACEFPLKEFRWTSPAFGHYSYARARVIADRLLEQYA